MNSFRSVAAPRDVALTVWFFCAATLSRVISEMKSLPGFGFSPNNEQIIDYVEKKRLDPDNFSVHMIQEIDIYSYEPWDLPGMQVSEEQVLYVFSEPYYKYNNSKRAHRRTSEGYWKSTGEGSKINQIGRKRILSFYHHGTKTAWVMHEFYIVKKKDSRYKKDYVMCLIKKKRDNKHGVSTTNDGQSNQQLATCSGQPLRENTNSDTVPAVQQPSNNLVSNRNQTTENISLKTQLPPSDPAISYVRNQGEENNIPYFQQLSSDPMNSSSTNDVAGNGSPASQQELPYHDIIPYYRNHVAGSGSLKLQPLANHNMISYPRNYISQNACGELQHQLSDQQLLSNQNLESSPDSQTLLNYNMISPSVSHIAVTASPQQLLQNQNLELLPNSGLMLPRNQTLDFGSMKIITEHTSNAQPPRLEEFNVGRGYSWLNNASSSAVQSPDSERGSPYSNCSNSGGDSLNSQFGSGRVNHPISPQRDFQNDYSGQEAGGTPIPHSNSSKPDRGVHVKDINDIDIDAWLNELPEDDISDMDIDARVNELREILN